MSASPSQAPSRRNTSPVLVSAIAAVLLAGAICLLAGVLYPKDLSVSTDIVGYPTAYDYNPRPYTVGYLLIAFALPALSIAIFWLLERRGIARDGVLPRTLPAEEPDPPAGTGTPLLAHLKLVPVGMLIATVVAIAVHASSWWPYGVGITIGYVIAASGAAALLARLIRLTIAESVAAINAAVASFGFVGVAVASESLQVEIQATAETVGYHLAPLWLLLIPAVAVVGAVTLLLVRGPRERWGAIERWTLLLVALPVLVYLAIVLLPGELWSPDLFHEGERLGGSALVFDRGEFPWRDILFTHGFLYDALSPLLRNLGFEDSRWGFAAAFELIERPALWISTLLLCVYLFRRNWLFLVTTQLLLVFGWFESFDHTRMVLVPLSLLTLAAILSKSTWPRAFLLMAVTLAQAILVPEAMVYSLAIWGAVVAYELTGRRTEAALPWRSSRTARSAVAGAVLGIAFLVYLVANDAVGGFADYYTTFVRSHDLTGAYEILWTDTRFHVWALLPIAVILVAWAYAAVRVFTRRWFTVAEWVAGTAVLGLIPYYLKFLGRPDDGHLFQVAFVTVIPLLYVLYRLVGALDARAARSGRTLLSHRPAAAGLLLGAVLLAPGAPLDVVERVPQNYTAVATTPPVNERMGYLDPTVDVTVYQRIQRVIDERAPDGSVFDFSGSPLLFSYLVDANPATRFYHASMAIREDAQEMLVEELAEERPELVVSSDGNWDGIPPTVRHYLVSDYLNDHYRPVDRVDKYVFWARRDAGSDEPPRGEEELYFEAAPCDWRYAPEFLDQEPAETAEAVAVQPVPAGTSTLVSTGGWAAGAGADEPAREVLVVAGERVIGRIAVGVARQDVVDALGKQSLLHAGFQATQMVIPRAADSDEIRFFGVNHDGVAGPLGQPADPAPASLRDTDGSEIEVDPGAVVGSVDSVRGVPMRRYDLDLPPDFRSFDWIELSAADPLGENLYLLSDALAGGGRTIAFRSLGRLDRESAQVRVGACPQWKGFGDRVSLHVVADSPPLAVRLTR